MADRPPGVPGICHPLLVNVVEQPVTAEASVGIHTQPTTSSYIPIAPRPENLPSPIRSDDFKKKRAVHDGSRIAKFFDDKNCSFKLGNRVDPKVDDRRYGYCTEKTENGGKCAARAYITKSNGSVQVYRGHTCVSNGQKFRKLKMYAAIKNNAETGLGTPHNCYLQARAAFPEAATELKYTPNLARVIRKWILNKFPQIRITVKTLPEICDYIQCNRKNFFREKIIDGIERKIQLQAHLITVYDGKSQMDRHSLLFFDEEFAHKIRATEQIFVDGTFAVCPKTNKVQQFVTIMGLYYKKPLPLFYILMEGKSEEDYNALFLKIKELCPIMKPAAAMLDFEKAFRSALRSSFPGLQTHGCLFHCFQALFRQAVTKGAATYKNKQRQPEKHLALLLIMSLAYLPASDIEKTYFHIKSDIQRDHGSHFDEFFTYFEREWLTIMKPSQWSVYGKTFTTNNHLESYHRFLKKFVGVKPQAEKIMDVIYNTWVDIYYLEKSSPTLSEEINEVESKNSKIKLVVADFDNHLITAVELVYRIARILFSCDIDYQKIIDPDNVEKESSADADAESEEKIIKLFEDMANLKEDETEVVTDNMYCESDEDMSSEWAIVARTDTRLTLRKTI